MDIDMNEQHWMDKKCPPINCRKKQCECGLEKVFLSAALGDDRKDSPIAPKNGEYCNAIVVYEANGHMYIYSKEGIPTLITSGGGGDYDEIIEEIQEDLANTEDDLAQEILDRIAGDNTLQDEIDAIKNSPDVVDIVATYAALQAYDTSKLGDNDIVRVLADEQHDGASTYYRWNKQSSTWTYIGEVGDYYTKGQVDDLLDGKQDALTAGANISIENDTISATYTHFTGATASTDGTQGLVPAPIAGDEGKFLKADGTWATAGGGGGPTVVQTTGTSTTDVMSQNAVTSELYVDPATRQKIRIGSQSFAYTNGVAIGFQAYANAANAVGIGNGAKGWSDRSVAIGSNAYAGNNNSVALGADARTSRVGEVFVGCENNNYGYNNTKLRVIGGVHDPVNAQDAATKGYVDTAIAGAGGANTINSTDWSALWQ